MRCGICKLIQCKLSKYFALYAYITPDIFTATNNFTHTNTYKLYFTVADYIIIFQVILGYMYKKSNVDKT